MGWSLSCGMIISLSFIATYPSISQGFLRSRASRYRRHRDLGAPLSNLLVQLHRTMFLQYAMIEPGPRSLLEQNTIGPSSYRLGYNREPVFL